MMKFAAYTLTLLSSFGLITSVHAEERPTPEWKQQATQSDIARFEKWEKSLSKGVAEAKSDGHTREIASRSPLFSTGIGKQSLGLPDGKYHCSITKLGGGRGLAYIAYPKFHCMVTKVGNRLQFTKLTGSQMTSGWIYHSDRAIGVYLGTSYYGYEDRAPKYGSDEKRDDIAVVERIGDQRWRTGVSIALL